MSQAEDLATEALLEFLNGCEAGIAAAKQVITEKKKPRGSHVDAT